MVHPASFIPCARSFIRHPSLLRSATTLAVYGQAVGFDFILHDDPTYVRDNPYLRAGLTLDGVRWAFSTTLGSNWHPLMWLSFMLDTALIGAHPGVYHLTNILLHTAEVSAWPVDHPATIHASMGPRSRDRGSPLRVFRLDPTPHGFNGAAVT